MGVGKTKKRLISSHSPDTIHWPSGLMATKELFIISPGAN